MPELYAASGAANRRSALQRKSRLGGLTPCAGCTNVSSAALRQAKLQSLQVIDFSRCPAVCTFGGLAHLVQAAAWLQAVNLDGTKLRDQSLLQLLNYCKTIKRLSLRQCYSLTDASLKEIAGQADLRVLDLSGVYGLTDAGMTPIARGCAKLLDLRLCGCAGLSNAPFHAMKQSMRGLRRVNLEGCDGIDDDGIASLCGANRWIEELTITKCAAIGDNGMFTIGSMLPNLRRLEANGLCNMTGIGHAAIAAGCTHLQRVNFAYQEALTGYGTCGTSCCSG